MTTPAQDDEIQYLNDAYGVYRFNDMDDGTVEVILDDGQKIVIDEEGNEL